MSRQREEGESGEQQVKPGAGSRHETKLGWEGWSRVFE